MKKSITALAAIAFVGAISTTAFAGPVGRFDNGYLDEHPEVAEQLGHDPRLVDNPRFLANHPGLDEYFKNHPEVRSDLQTIPTASWRASATTITTRDGTVRIR